MHGLEIIGKIMKTYRIKLGITYSLFSLEMFGALLRPFFLGMAVNDLIVGSYRGLIILSVIHFCWLIIGTIRHMYDTRTYTAIYTSLVTRFLSRNYSISEVSKLSAHSTLSRELVDFLESDLPYIIEAIFNILGSIILLYFYDKEVVLVCFFILIPVLFISYFYGKKMRSLTKFKNDELEKEVNVISLGNNDSIKTHYNKLRRWQIKISDKEAWNFGIIETMVLIVIAGSLMISSNVFGTTILAGNLIGIYNYMLRFVSGLDTIPYTIQRVSTIRDVVNRIQIKEEDIVGPMTPIKELTQQYTQGELKLSA